MAEPRRIQLTNLCSGLSLFSDSLASAQKDSVSVKTNEPASSGLENKGSVRLFLKLFEPDDQNFPEFNFCHLVEKEVSQTDVQRSRLEHEEKQENGQLLEVARSLETKYGGIKTDRIQDLIDIGYGYDDEDSFIDNSEPYDEFVPAAITPKYGGFYINSGELQFRQVTSRENDDLSKREETSKIKKKRKGNDKQKESKKKHHREKGMDWEKKLCPLPADNKRIKKKKKTGRILSVTGTLKKYKREKEWMEKAAENVAPNLLPADAAGGGGGAGLTEPLLNLISSTTDHALIQAASTGDFEIDLDSFLDITDDPLSPHPQTSTQSQLIQSETDDRKPFEIWMETEAQVEKTKSTPPTKFNSEDIEFETSFTSTQWDPLPEGIPPEMEGNIRKLMMAAKTAERESKPKFFNPNINSVLAEIELQCREQGGQLRSRVYRHLSSFMPCSKNALLRRVRRLSIPHSEKPRCVENSLQKLKEAIERSMPEQIMSFHKSRQVYEQLKTSKADEEDNSDGKNGQKVPKKLFKWNQEIRECLHHVLREKMNTCEKGQEMEEYIEILLKKDIKHLWPKGWMTLRMLMRESKKLLSLTSLSGNKEKCIKETSVCMTSKSSDSRKSLLTSSEVLQRADVDLTTEIPACVSVCEQQMKDGALKNNEVEVDSGFCFPLLLGKSICLVDATSVPSCSALPEVAPPGQEPLCNKPLAAAIPAQRSFSGDPSSPCPQSCQVKVQQSWLDGRPRLQQARDVRFESHEIVMIESSDDSAVF